ncbi:M28 family metallopeptidase [Metamycoplasma hyosynoviae]|uniref:M28 family metallopeptidase n=1 Tax=Metamycoplasma hyosynoviae TaxID=29559 RepID=A0A9Q9BSV7_9BACT|nr:M28 family peptidase [Metamycoplasma hyosynoviae]MDC8900552.1 M28 family peptidase [Metamycoplasma hyosynoviae]MDC8917833.1 M28 family peptidase [Metamycoplasma hyosynoviae]MDC8918665.1 M28 family peptidase [Metamycoplasma hyosynoviae]MDC8922035.1 M28 family peptidase [Metamycoplasma hyosynoviae]MDD1358981.1 M28 family peptidase [Metamycoplasma hyosynoviae]
MKKQKIIAIVSPLAIASILAPIATISVQCGSKALPKDLEVYKQFQSFINTTHGRKTGNLNNFKKESLEAEFNADGSLKAHKGIKLPAGKELTSEVLQPYYPLEDANVDKKVNIYGSYRAFQYLRKTIADMGYKDHTGNIIKYPKQNKIEATSITAETETRIANLEDGEKTITVYSDDQPIVKEMKEHIKKDGFFSQGFLYQLGGTKGQVINTNNIGTNIVVTINPSEKVTKTKDSKTLEVKDFYIVSHFDSTNNVGPKGVSWGATDNGSGVSVNLSLLKYFSDPKNRDNLGVRLHLVFVDAEEIGVMGSQAFVEQFLISNIQGNKETNELLASSLGMINMDTVSGGDKMYVHSPNTKQDPNLGSASGNLSTTIRDQLHSLSKLRSQKLNDSTQELEIHPQFSPTQYGAGETGDWSDHFPFYNKAKLPVAYIESTNFAIFSKTGSYDGYAQTTNPKAWVLKNGKNMQLVKRTLNGGLLEVYDWPEGITRKDIAIAGDIWHSDLDTNKWVDENLGARFYRQLDTVLETLKTFLVSMWEIGDDGNGTPIINYTI